jgi:hypothetical protein
MGSAERIQRSRTPCAHRLGERTKRQRLGRVMSPRDVTRQPPRRRAIIPEPGPRTVRAGLAPIRPGAPRAFHGVDDFDIGAADEIAGHHYRGALQPCGLCTPEHPSAKRMTTGLRPGWWPSPSLRRLASSASRLPWTRRQDASNPFLQPTFRVTSTRGNNTFGDCLPERPWEKPASDRAPDRPGDGAFPPFRPRRRRTTSRSSGLQRPSCLTARRRLRAARLPRCARARGGGESAGALSATERLVDANPLTPLVGGRSRNA